MKSSRESDRKHLDINEGCTHMITEKTNSAIYCLAILAFLYSCTSTSVKSNTSIDSQPAEDSSTASGRAESEDSSATTQVPSERKEGGEPQAASDGDAMKDEDRASKDQAEHKAKVKAQELGYSISGHVVETEETSDYWIVNFVPSSSEMLGGGLVIRISRTTGEVLDFKFQQ